MRTIEQIPPLPLHTSPYVSIATSNAARESSDMLTGK